MNASLYSAGIYKRIKRVMYAACNNIIDVYSNRTIRTDNTDFKYKSEKSLIT